MSNAGSVNGDFLGGIRGRMAALTDDELLRVVTIEAQDYRTEAIDIAWAELRRRGIEAPSPRDVERIQQRDTEERRNAPLQKIRWLKFYIFFIAVDLVGAVYFFIRDVRLLSAGWLISRSCQLGLLGFLLPGMIRRKGWAYYLNWLYLAVTVYTMSTRSSAVWWSLPLYSLVWAVPNFIYFRKRRQLFSPE
jgi:hypothetical protein